MAEAPHLYDPTEVDAEYVGMEHLSAFSKLHLWKYNVFIFTRPYYQIRSTWPKMNYKMSRRPMQESVVKGQVTLSQEAHAVKASEGRWPRICERTYEAAMPLVRCAHVF